MNSNNCQVVSVTNFKGGVGKSTVTFNLGAGLAYKGYRILIIDFDPQQSLTSYTGAGYNESNIASALFDVMEGQYSADPIYPLRDNLDIIPGSSMLEKWTVDAMSMMSRETILKRYIDRIRSIGIYDFILIDNGPAVNIRLQNALVACDRYLIVTEAERGSVEALEAILDIIEQVKLYCNPHLTSAGILFNKYKKNINLHRIEDEIVKEVWGGSHHIYESVIPNYADIASSEAVEMTVYEYKRNSPAAEAYRRFVDEFIEVMKNDA